MRMMMTMMMMMILILMIPMIPMTRMMMIRKYASIYWRESWSIFRTTRCTTTCSTYSNHQILLLTISWPLASCFNRQLNCIGGFRFLFSYLAEGFGRCEIRAVSPPANGSLVEGEMALCLNATNLGTNSNFDHRTTAPWPLFHSVENCSKSYDLLQLMWFGNYASYKLCNKIWKWYSRPDGKLNIDLVFMWIWNS